MDLTLTWLMCPRCSQGMTHDTKCGTAACAELNLKNDLTYRRDVIDGNLYVAQAYLAEGNTDEDWARLVPELTAELAAFDEKMVETVGLEGTTAKTAARFRQ